MDAGQDQELDQGYDADNDGDRSHRPRLFLISGLFAVHPQQHDHEQEKDHDGPGVYDYLDGSQEIGTLVDEKQSDTENGGDKGEGAVDRVAAEHDSGGTADHQCGADGVHSPRGRVRQGVGS